MSLIESVAAFEQRCDQLNATGEIKTGLRNQGINSFSLLAFSVGSPQSPPTEVQLDGFAQRVYGAPPSIGQLANLKRLFFEATTLVIASLKQSVSNETAEQQQTVKRLPIAEKRARADNQATRLAGLTFSGEMEPSHHLIDLVNTMLETGCLTWIAPSKCSKRDDEIQVSIKQSTNTIQVENAVLKVAQTSADIPVDTGSELKLQWCWQRRGVAFDRCNLLSWSVHNKWINAMLNNLTHAPPPGFGAIKVDQLIRADRELFTLIARENLPSLKPVGGVPPLDARVEAYMNDPRITMFMLPLPISQKAVKDEIATEVKQSQQVRDSDSPRIKKGPKKRKSRAEKSCPEELKKFKMNYTHGRICWSFNLKYGCSLQTEKVDNKGYKCNKGFHVCAACHKPGHSALVCRSKA